MDTVAIPIQNSKNLRVLLDMVSRLVVL